MPKQKTPEEIAAMEEEVRQFRIAEAEEAAKQKLEAAQPLLEVLDREEFMKVEASIADLDNLVGQFPEIRVHVDALRHGVAGLRLVSSSLAPSRFIPPEVIKEPIP